MTTTFEKIYLSFIFFLCLSFLFIGFYCTLFCQFIIYFLYCSIYHFILKDLNAITFIKGFQQNSIYITKNEFYLLIPFMFSFFIVGDIIFFIYDNFPFSTIFYFFRF